ncbi:Sec-independent protein translocase TatC [Lishizhenia tianjinensis]|uniref:Sec-independent protein translocase protein TatC n=1 Tax=Lishizhenia tianjinensis TaxID=477690 RepID=A0A1I7A0Y3_9FLAO|nr:twin-arginine translocase subunit TatC [Lishizhenia tianjinensis]SFT68585.1 Sec-independent protein translocase TatC [Lishizhenia tianjinensis]
MEEGNEMSFLEHLEELRWRLVRSVIAIVVLAIGLFVCLEWIMDNIFLSMNSENFISYRVMCEYVNLCVEVTPVKAQGLKMTSQFSYALLISFLGGFIIAFPYVFYQLWSFVKPGLRQNERKTFSGIVFYVSLLFFFGVLFGYFVVAPMCVQFFGEFRISPDIETNPGIDSYVSLITSTVFYTGLLFLLPVVIFLLSKIGIVTPAFLKKYRKHAIVGVLVLSAIITPPDFISQIIVSIPILILYEIGIILSKRVEKEQLIKQS